MLAACGTWSDSDKRWQVEAPRTLRSLLLSDGVLHAGQIDRRFFCTVQVRGQVQFVWPNRAECNGCAALSGFAAVHRIKIQAFLCYCSRMSARVRSCRYTVRTPEHRTDLSRRRVLAGGAAVALAAALPRMAQSAEEPLRTRKIPRSGEELPVIGIGTAVIFDFENDAVKYAERRQ